MMTGFVNSQTIKTRFNQLDFQKSLSASFIDELSNKYNIQTLTMKTNQNTYSSAIVGYNDVIAVIIHGPKID